MTGPASRAQQAAEKAARAVFQRMGAEAWGHSLADLLIELRRRHRVPEALHDPALDLDKAYLPARLPTAHPSGSPRTRYTRAEATRLIDHAAHVIEFCSGFLSRL